MRPPPLIPLVLSPLLLTTLSTSAALPIPPPHDEFPSAATTLIGIASCAIIYCIISCCSSVNDLLQQRQEMRQEMRRIEVAAQVAENLRRMAPEHGVVRAGWRVQMARHRGRIPGMGRARMRDHLEVVHPRGPTGGRPCVGGSCGRGGVGRTGRG